MNEITSLLPSDVRRDEETQIACIYLRPEMTKGVNRRSNLTGVVRNRALKDGVVCYLSKPVDDDRLERCLRSALRPGTPIEENS